MMKATDFCDASGILLQTTHYLLRRLQQEDLSAYEALAEIAVPAFLPTSSTALAWEDLLDESCLTCSILEKNSLTFCGFCQLQWIDSPFPILGIDLLPDFQQKGIAAEVLPPFLSHMKMHLPQAVFVARIQKNNYPSQKLAKKIGGICVGSHSLLPANFPQSQLSFAEENFPELFFLDYHF